MCRGLPMSWSDAGWAIDLHPVAAPSGAHGLRGRPKGGARGHAGSTARSQSSGPVRLREWGSRGGPVWESPHIDYAPISVLSHTLLLSISYIPGNSFQTCEEVSPKLFRDFPSNCTMSKLATGSQLFFKFSN